MKFPTPAQGLAGCPENNCWAAWLIFHPESSCVKWKVCPYICHHWCSRETLSSFDWAFNLEEQDGDGCLVNFPVLEEEALPLSLQKNKASLISLQKEIHATPPNSFEGYSCSETLNGNLNFWICSVMTEAAPVKQTLPNTKTLLESHCKEWTMNLLQKKTDNSGVAWWKPSFGYIKTHPYTHMRTHTHTHTHTHSHTRTPLALKFLAIVWISYWS